MNVNASWKVKTIKDILYSPSFIINKYNYDCDGVYEVDKIDNYNKKITRMK